MPSELIARAQQMTRQRLTQAFDNFCGSTPGESRLELTDPAQLPSHEPIRLPYDDGAFDWVACHELLDTFGSHERQVRLLRELLRVARRGIFVSAASRGHPLSRWMYPQRHSLLLDALTIKTMVDVLPSHPNWKLGHVRLAGFKSHYYLMVWKKSRRADQKTGGQATLDKGRSDTPPPAASQPARG